MERKQRKYEKKPLWRKVNTTAHGVKGRMHRNSGTIKYNRHQKENLNAKSKMKSGNQMHGLDFTPLYGFLRKNVGKKWNDVYSEAKSRLPKDARYDPIKCAVYSYEDYMSLKHENKLNDKFIDFESSYHSQLYVDENGFLQYVNAELTVEDVRSTCNCCTFTFNGKKVPKSKEIIY